MSKQLPYMGPGDKRLRTHTLDDIMIFHDSSEIVKRAGQMWAQDSDYDVMRRAVSDRLIEMHELAAEADAEYDRARGDFDPYEAAGESRFGLPGGGSL